MINILPTNIRALGGFSFVKQGNFCAAILNFLTLVNSRPVNVDDGLSLLSGCPGNLLCETKYLSMFAKQYYLKFDSCEMV